MSHAHAKIKIMDRIKLQLAEKAFGECRKGFESRMMRGFWDTFVKPGPVLDIGYRGASIDAQPIFPEAVGLDHGTPGYNGRDLPFPNDSVGTIHASHLLEHIADYVHFYRECMRALYPGGTLIIMVPLMQAYEGLPIPPSVFNPDHKRFYTASRLLMELESSLSRMEYRVVHLNELFNTNDIFRSSGHAVGPLYEIECVVEKIIPGKHYL